MSNLFDQDAKGYFFDMECPELTGSESSKSPTDSCFTSGGAFTPPSPCLDAKDPTLSESGMQTYSTFSDLSPLSGFGDSCLNMDSSWSEQPATVSCNTTSQYNSSIWPCSQYAPAQPLLNATGHIPAMPTQPQADGLFAPSIFEEMPSMTVPHLPPNSVEQHMPTGFVGYEAEGLVAPGHLFNTTLDKFAFMDTKPVLFSTQPITEDSLAFEPLPSTNELDVSSQPVEQAVRYIPEMARNNRDEYLQEARRRGLSYKEIKRRGGFTEAESTLRGRIRILSKPKEMRVRKPQWNRSDIMLLIEAVECFSEASQDSSSRKSNVRQRGTANKLPWKKVAEWMLSHGASYPFAGATCAKKWEQIREISF
ncbi:hypothetical protein E4T50_16102 [Aureobasidium sp. EXF-12298]|nr:hypothetical protein E4T50_16102 [Aureobasidium sp. EXF-12298]KAI4763915.1 hypothetical protein E4T51_03107 [Aureobasidium sp. EXF-12344]KAI4768735.1 hypothetical protein E4T52_16191 [Aureobasidium sp. EXF-3400]